MPFRAQHLGLEQQRGREQSWPAEAAPAGGRPPADAGIQEGGPARLLPSSQAHAPPPASSLSSPVKRAGRTPAQGPHLAAPERGRPPFPCPGCDQDLLVPLAPNPGFPCPQGPASRCRPWAEMLALSRWPVSGSCPETERPERPTPGAGGAKINLLLTRPQSSPGAGSRRRCGRAEEEAMVLAGGGGSVHSLLSPRLPLRPTPLWCGAPRPPEEEELRNAASQNL